MWNLKNFIIQAIKVQLWDMTSLTKKQSLIGFEAMHAQT